MPGRSPGEAGDQLASGGWNSSNKARHTSVRVGGDAVGAGDVAAPPGLF